MKWEITRSQYKNDRKVITVRGLYVEECIDYINKNNIEGVYFSSWQYSLADLNFLLRCKSIQEVHLDSKKIIDVSGLQQLPELDTIIISRLNEPLDLKPFRKIKYLSSSYATIKNLDMLENLKYLYLREVNVSNKEFAVFENLKKLETLSITLGNLSTLKSLAGLSSLENLEISHFKRLENIEGLKCLSKGLKTLRIDNSKRIKSFNIVGQLVELEELFLCDVGDIESIEFIKDLEHLKSLVFMGTNVLDGNMNYCKRLKHVEFNDKEHYSNVSDEFNKCTDIKVD